MMGGGATTPPFRAYSSSRFPVPTSTSSYWRSEPHDLDEVQSTPELAHECDILIIGAGMSGIASAYHILQRHKALHPETAPPSIVLVEARQICSGATGRNGGHAKLRASFMPRTLKKQGLEDTQELWSLVKKNVFAMKAVIEKEGIDCEAEFRRSFDVCLDEKEAEEVEEEFEWMRRESGLSGLEELDVVKGKNVKHITSMKDAAFATSTFALSFWPYKFVTQMLARCLATGAVKAYTNTLVKTLYKSGSSTLAVTSRGNIMTRKVVYATNAYTSALIPRYTNVITPVKGTACHIAPSPTAETPPPYLSNTYNIRYEPHRVDYMNPRPDGGIVIGGAKWTFEDAREKWFDVVDDSTLLYDAHNHFDGLMQRNFSGWEKSGAKVDSIWTGIMGQTPDEAPHVGKVPLNPNHYVLAGFNGGGMALIWLVAEGVAKMVVDGVSFEETGLPKKFKTGGRRMDVRFPSSST